MFLKTFLIIFAIYWLIASISCYLFLKKQIQTRLRFIFQTDPQQLQPKYRPFQRTDFPNWKISRIYRNCFLLFPIKFLILLSYVINAVLLIFLIAFIERVLNKPYIPTLRSIFKFYMTKLVAPTLHILCSVKQVNINTKTSQNPIIISNHISWWEILYYITSRWPIAFLAKQEVRRWPLIGIIAQFAGSIFLEREDASARSNTINLIKQRCDMMKIDRNRYPPLLIFPEGTTTNGEFVINFKRGAFESLQPVQVSVLNYYGDWNVSMDAMGQLTNILLFLCNYPKLEITNVYDVSPKSQSVEEYMGDCQRIMVGSGKKREVMQSGFRAKKEYQSTLKVKIRAH